jgi:hypothetical protein
MIGSHLVETANFANQVPERFIDVDSALCRGFNELALAVASKVAALCKLYQNTTIGKGDLECTVHADLTLILEITLVRDNDNREVVFVLDTENLLVEGLDFLI